jgi:hypothetical protein
VGDGVAVGGTVTPGGTGVEVGAGGGVGVGVGSDTAPTHIRRAFSSGSNTGSLTDIFTW